MKNRHKKSTQGQVDHIFLAIISSVENSWGETWTDSVVENSSELDSKVNYYLVVAKTNLLQALRT